MNAVTMQTSKAIVRLETGSRVVFVRSSPPLRPICLHMLIRNALTTCLLTTALIANAPACVAAGAALPNGERATINQFRDEGANGLVELAVDVDGSHPRLVDFDLSHPSAAMPRCIGADGIAFEAYVSPLAKLAYPPRKQSDKPASTYANVRYGYTIEYPGDLLVAGREADNSDGLVFSAKSGKTQVAVWGRFSSPDDTPAQLLHSEEQRTCAGSRASYEVSKRNLVAFSCQTQNNEIVYEKMLIHGGTLAIVQFTYPVAEQATWSPVVKQMAGSLRIE